MKAMDVRDREFRQEILEDLKKGFSQGLDKTISARTNPIRWILLHYFIGLNVMVFFYFLWEGALPPGSRWSLPTGFMKYFTFAFPFVISLLHLWWSRQHGGPIILSRPLPPPAGSPSRRFISLYWQELLTVFMFAAWAGGYFLIATKIDPAHTEHIGMRIDRQIPFIPDFVFIYIGLYTMYVYPYLLVKDKEFFKVFTGAYVTLIVIIYTVFILFPVSIVRPEIQVTDFTSWTLGIVYSLDKPVNCFPSSHVAMTLMSALTIWEINRLWGAAAIFYALAIAVSTLFLKQHYVLDVVVSMVITGIVYYAYFQQKITRVLGRNIREWEQEMENNLVQWIENRLSPILEPIIARRVEEAVKKALKETREGEGVKGE